MPKEILETVTDDTFVLLVDDSSVQRKEPYLVGAALNPGSTKAWEQRLIQGHNNAKPGEVTGVELPKFLERR